VANFFQLTLSASSVLAVIAGPNEGPDNSLGDGRHRLHEWCRWHGRDHAARVRRRPQQRHQRSTHLPATTRGRSLV